MSITQLRDISNICMVAGLLLLAVAAVMYVKMDIDKAWHFLSGRRIDEPGMKKGKAQRHKRKKDDKTLALTDALPGERKTVEECTERLQPEEIPQCQETTLLQPEDEKFDIVYEVTYIHTDLI